jgi:mannose-6-phosphate isomerase-like protein (cupin superfamily)
MRTAPPCLIITGVTNGGAPMTTATRRAWWFLDVLVEELPTVGGPVVGEATLPEGASPPLHVHHHLDDSFCLLDGRIVVRCGERVWEAKTGDWIPFPPGTPHTFRVLDGPARVLMVHADDSFMAFVRDVGEEVAPGETPVATGGLGIDALNRAAERHDMANVGPSMTEEEARAFLTSA